MRPKTDGILESSLYVSDVPRSVLFYQQTFGFTVISEFGERGCAMQAGPRQVLLLFRKGASRAITSPHDGDGELHLAFAICGLERVGAYSNPDNARSTRALERLGFRHEGVLRAWHRHGDTHHDVNIFGLLREDWRGAPFDVDVDVEGEPPPAWIVRRGAAPS